jgi:hypothetical protein
MAQKPDVKLELIVEAKKAIAALEKFEKDAAGAVKRTEKSFFQLSDSTKDLGKVLAGAFAAKKIFDFFAGGVEAANAQEKALALLSQQLKNTGDFSAEAVDDFKSFADTMEATTTFGDDLVLSQLAVAKSFGVSNEQAKDLVKAATELSAVTGDDLNTSVDKLGKTLAGTPGKLGKTIAGFDSLTEAELKAGGGIKFVLEQFGGSQAALLDTFGGATTQLSNSFGNLAEAFGDILVSNPAVVSALQGLKDVLNFLVAAVENNKDSLKAFVGGALKGVAATVSGIADAFAFLTEVVVATTGAVIDGIGGLAQTAGKILTFVPGADAAADAMIRFGTETRENANEITAKLGGMQQGFNGFAAVVASGAQKIFDSDFKIVKSAESAKQGRRQAFEQASKDMEKFAKQALELEAKLRGEQGNEFDKTIQGALKYYADIARLRKENAFGDEKAAELRVLVQKQMHEKLSKLTAEYQAKEIEEAKKRAEDLRKQVEEIAANPVKLVVENVRPIDLSAKAQKGIAAGAGLVDRALDGAEGARGLIADGAGALADKLVPGIGGAFGSIIGKLAEGPEATKQFIRDFVESAPEFITNVAESIPVVVEALVDSLINKGGLIKIAIALGKAMLGVSIWKALGKQIFSGIDFGNVGKEVGGAISKGVEDLIAFDKRFRETLANLTGQKKLFEADERLRKTFTEGAQKLFKSIGEGATKLFEFDKRLRVAVGEMLSGIGAKVAAGFAPFFQRFAQLKLPTLKIPDLLVVGQKIVDAAQRGGQALFNGIASGAQKLFQFDARIRTAGAEFAANLFEKIKAAFNAAVSALGAPLGRLLSFKLPEFKLPSWLADFKGIVGRLTTTPSWLSSFISAVNSLTSFSFGGGGGFLGQVFGSANADVSGPAIRDTVANQSGGAALTADAPAAPVPTAVEGDGMAQLISLMGRLVVAVESGQTVETDITIDGRRLAKAILDLQYTNARVAR